MEEIYQGYALEGVYPVLTPFLSYSVSTLATMR
jgi:hypothetical protein